MDKRGRQGQGEGCEELCWSPSLCPWGRLRSGGVVVFPLGLPEQPGSQVGTAPGPKKRKETRLCWGCRELFPKRGFGTVATAQDVEERIQVEGEARAKCRFIVCPGESKSPELTIEQGLGEHPWNARMRAVVLRCEATGSHRRFRKKGC